MSSREETAAAEETAQTAQGRLQQLFPEWIVSLSVVNASTRVYRLRLTTKEKDLDISASFRLRDGADHFELIVEVLEALVEASRLPPLPIEEFGDDGFYFCKGHVDKERFSAQLLHREDAEIPAEEVIHGFMRMEFHGTPREPYYQCYAEKVRGGTPVTFASYD